MPSNGFLTHRQLVERKQLLLKGQAARLQLGGAGSGAGGGEKAYMCKVGSGSAKAGYQVTVYPNGRENTGSAEYGTLYVPDLALDADLPSGTWLIGHKCALKTTGGNDT